MKTHTTDAGCLIWLFLSLLSMMNWRRDKKIPRKNRYFYVVANDISADVRAVKFLSAIKRHFASADIISLAAEMEMEWEMARIEWGKKMSNSVLQTV